jgi:hypothetical protein
MPPEPSVTDRDRIRRVEARLAHVEDRLSMIEHPRRAPTRRLPRLSTEQWYLVLMAFAVAAEVTVAILRRKGQS